MTKLTRIINILIKEKVGISILEIEKIVGKGPTSVSSSVSGLITLIQGIDILMEKYFKVLEIKEGNHINYFYRFESCDSYDQLSIENIIKEFHKKIKKK